MCLSVTRPGIKGNTTLTYTSTLLAIGIQSIYNGMQLFITIIIIIVNIIIIIIIIKGCRLFVY